ncbi:MAG: hypothetical protein IH624_03590 [Phycisphaerae bacterium]|nr:hypothetical protein [Phycisphaerae bacterium]
MNNPWNAETGCCPRFDPGPWQEKEVAWEDKLFVKDRVRTFCYMPLGFGKVVVRNMAKIEKAGAFTAEPLMLSDHTSKWNMDVYIAVTKEVPDADNVRLSGTYLSKVFEGPYKDTGKWCSQMRQWVESGGRTIGKLFMFYTTCPRCAKTYGKNYTVILAQV